MTGIHMKCHQCNQVLDIPENFFESGAHPFWFQHGHFPMMISFIAGEDVLLVGPSTGKDPDTAVKESIAFYQEHKECSCSPNQYSESCVDHGSNPELYQN
jgi:hypothetical protein